jgi:hypothetical protein
MNQVDRYIAASTLMKSNCLWCNQVYIHGSQNTTQNLINMVTGEVHGEGHCPHSLCYNEHAFPEAAHSNAEGHTTYLF